MSVLGFDGRALIPIMGLLLLAGTGCGSSSHSSSAQAQSPSPSDTSGSALCGQFDLTTVRRLVDLPSAQVTGERSEIDSSTTEVDCTWQQIDGSQARIGVLTKPGGTFLADIAKANGSVQTKCQSQTIHGRAGLVCASLSYLTTATGGLVVSVARMDDHSTEPAERAALIDYAAGVVS